ncbi:TATA element modulatory factor-like, partial [Tropilaelaps mercedesae]
MSGWFDTKSFTSLAKSALSQAQKQIDKALEAVADEDSDSDETEVSSLDPFGSGWAIRKPKMKKEIEKKTTTELNQVGPVHSGDNFYGFVREDNADNACQDDREMVVTDQIREEPDKPVIEVNPVTSQVKSTPDTVVGPVTVQVRSQKTDEGDGFNETPSVLGENVLCGENCQTKEGDTSSSVVGPQVMGTSSESVETTIQQGSDLEFSMLEEAKDEAFTAVSSASPKSTSPVCPSDSSGGSGAISGDGETAASSDIEIISAINSTPSEALHHDQSALWDDALTDALRELSGEMGLGAAASATAAMETLLHAREQKAYIYIYIYIYIFSQIYVMTLSGDNARLAEDNEKLRERVAQLETRNLEACRNSSEQVQQLLAEGEKLAREVLEKANTLKRLRAKEREQDELVKKHAKNIDELNVQLERLRRSLAQKDVQEKFHIEQIRELKAAKITAADLKMQLDAARSRCQELEKRNTKILMESKVMTASVEMTAQDQLRSGMAELKARHSGEVESLRQKVSQKGFENEIVNLQGVAETLRQKISDLEDKFKIITKEKHAVETQCQSLSDKVTELESELNKTECVQLPVKPVDTTTQEYIEVLKGQLVEREDAITKMNQSIELLKSRCVRLHIYIYIYIY